jgi:hypothetical protein
MNSHNTQQYVNLTDVEIKLFNEIFSDPKYIFQNYFHSDNGTDKVFCVFKTNETISKRDDIVNLFQKFHGNNPNKMKITTKGILLYAALCSISRDITHKFPEDFNKQLDKNDLFGLFEKMIDPSQHDKLLKKEEIKMFECKDKNNNIIPPIKATETYIPEPAQKPSPKPALNPMKNQNQNTQQKPSSCFNLSSITEFFKKIINFISCGLLCNNKEKTKTN